MVKYKSLRFIQVETSYGSCSIDSLDTYNFLFSEDARGNNVAIDNTGGNSVCIDYKLSTIGGVNKKLRDIPNLFRFLMKSKIFSFIIE